MNKQTNANVIAFSEQWLDAVETDIYHDTNLVTQDAGLMNVAQKVSGLSSLTPDTWSNLVLSLTFGDINFSSSLSAASVLTSSNAVFYEANNIPINIYVARSGDTFIVTLQTVNYINPTINPSAIIANLYLSQGGKIVDQQPFSLMLQDGNTSATYANIAQTIYITGNNTTNSDAAGDLLNNIQISGASDNASPTITITTPKPGLNVSNASYLVTGKAADNVAVSNVFCR